MELLFLLVCICEVLLAADEHCEEIHPKLLFFMFDGCRHGVEASLLQPFKKQSDNKTMVKSKHQLYVLYDEAGLSRRRGCVRGPNALDQVEFIHLVSASPVKVADKKRIHYDGTSFGNCLGPVTVAAAADVWCVDMSIKKKGLRRVEPSRRGRQGARYGDHPHQGLAGHQQP